MFPEPKILLHLSLRKESFKQIIARLVSA